MEAGWRLAPELSGPGAAVGCGRGVLAAHPEKQTQVRQAICTGDTNDLLLTLEKSESFSRCKFHTKCRHISKNPTKARKKNVGCWLMTLLSKKRESFYGWLHFPLRLYSLSTSNESEKNLPGCGRSEMGSHTVLWDGK